MDFLDPQKRRRHAIRLMVGYVLIGLAIAIGTTVLLFAAYGFGLGKNDQVVQNGFVFVSSGPVSAQIYLNGKPAKVATNARLSLVSGEYFMELKANGYRTWQRQISVEGGTVEHYDYPVLFPQKLVTSQVKTYDAAPALATQSPDRRWLLVAQPSNSAGFDLFDLKNPKTAPTVITIPDGILSPAKSSQSWQLVEWSTDNRHVLLKHIFDGSSEYVMVDRQDPTQTFNLTKTLGTNPTSVALHDKKYDQYYLYDAATQTLSTASLKDPAPTTFLTDIINYFPYGSDLMLYATTDKAPAGKVVFDLLQGGKTYQLRTATAGSTYLLNMAQHGSHWFVAVGASTEDHIYVYKDPASQLDNSQNAEPVAVPVQILKVKSPNYISFSDNTQFVMDENGSSFSVYDVENDKAYNYTVTAQFDPGQPHATWMDGSHLEYVSGGKLLVFDFDRANEQTLMAAAAGYRPFFDPGYKFVDSLAPSGTTATQMALTSTSLRAP